MLELVVKTIAVILGLVIVFLIAEHVTAANARRSILLEVFKTLPSVPFVFIEDSKRITSKRWNYVGLVSKHRESIFDEYNSVFECKNCKARHILEYTWKHQVAYTKCANCEGIVKGSSTSSIPYYRPPDS